MASPHGYIDLPVGYNHLIQSAIYNNLNPEFAAFLHNQGFIINKRRFTLFVFSRILGLHQYLREKKEIRFANPMQLIISSPVIQFTKDISQVFLKNGIRIGKYLLDIQSFEVQAPTIKNNETIVTSLSPVVAYSTFMRGHGKKYTLYYKPNDQEFQRIVVENLKRKARLIYGEEKQFSETSIVRKGMFHREIVMYKGTIIKGYSGTFILKGDPHLLQTAIDAGLGSKNSMGFGLLQVINK